MKIRGPLPEPKQTPHHPDELKPGHLRFTAERIEAAAAVYRESEFVAPDLLEVLKRQLLLAERWFGELAAVTSEYSLPVALIEEQIAAGEYLWKDARLVFPRESMNKLAAETIELAMFAEPEVRTALAAWLTRCQAAENNEISDLIHLNIARTPRRLNEKIEAASLSREEFYFVMRNIGSIALPPFAAKLAGAIDDEKWQKSICPICGNEPASAALVGEGGKRHLYCDTCGMVWTFNRVRCPFCGNDEQEKLAMLNTDDQSQYLLDACKSCLRFIKTVDYRKADATRPVLLPIEDAATLYLDILAGNEGFRREVDE